MNNISTWSIRNPVPPIAIFVVLVLMGFYAFRNLPVTAMPNMDLPLVSVTVAQPGAAPSELVRQVIEPVEDAISAINGVRHITSKATDSTASIQIEFELETNTDRAVNDVKDAVAQARSDLPESVLEPLVQRIDITGMPVLIYAVSDPTKSIEALSEFVDDVVGRELANIPAIAQTQRIGGAERQIRVELIPERVQAVGLTTAEVSDQLRAKNIDMGAGRGDLYGSEYRLRALGGAASVDQLAATPIVIGGGKSVRLDELGRISDGADNPRSFALMDGQPVVAFGILRATGKSDLEAGDGAKAKIAEIAASHPNVRFSLIDDATTETRNIFHSTMETLYEGAALAMIVVLLFLRNIRATVIAAVALPLSVIPTFMLMHWLGFSLNLVSLLGITLVTGILVDDAIVEIENIDRHIHMGLPPYEASERAATEIGMTVIAISFSIVAVFAPVGLMGGIPGQIFKQFGLTVSVAVLFSLIVARTITPMMGAYLMKGIAAPSEKRDSIFLRALMAVLRWTMRHRGLTLLAGIAVFALSIYSATLLPTEFVPSSDVGRSQITVELPPGGTISQSQEATRMVSERIARAAPEVKSVFVIGGEGDVTMSRIVVNYGRKETRDRSSFEIERDLKRDLGQLPDLRINFQNEVGQNDLLLTVRGDTAASSTAAADMMVEAMRGLSGLEDVRSSGSLLRPELRIHPKPELAARLGVTTAALATTLSVATIGDTESNLAKFSAGDKQVPILVQLDESARTDLERLSALRLPSAQGQVPLLAVADLSYGAGAAQIERYDRRFSTTITANLADGAVLGPVNAEVAALQEKLDLPPGSEIKPTGDAEIMAEVFTSFATAMVSGVMFVYIVLVLLFRNFIVPVSIILSLPLAIGGAIIALYLTGDSISLAVVIGFLMLMGIVTKNAIMLVEFALTAMTRGMALREAILDAVHKRARPIIMTTIAMVAGMVPAAIGAGGGAEFSSPMAVAVIGGLLLSTMLSMLFVPALFSVIWGLGQRIGGGLSRLIGLNSAPDRQS